MPPEACISFDFLQGEAQQLASFVQLPANFCKNNCRAFQGSLCSRRKLWESFGDQSDWGDGYFAIQRAQKRFRVQAKITRVSAQKAAPLGFGRQATEIPPFQRFKIVQADVGCLSNLL